MLVGCVTTGTTTPSTVFSASQCVPFSSNPGNPTVSIWTNDPICNAGPYLGNCGSLAVQTSTNPPETVTNSTWNIPANADLLVGATASEPIAGVTTLEIDGEFAFCDINGQNSVSSFHDSASPQSSPPLVVWGYNDINICPPTSSGGEQMPISVSVSYNVNSLNNANQVGSSSYMQVNYGFNAWATNAKYTSRVGVVPVAVAEDNYAIFFWATANNNNNNNKNLVPNAYCNPGPLAGKTPGWRAEQ